MNTKTLKGYLYALLSAFIYGATPLAATLIYDDGVTPLTLVFLGNALALPVLAILAFLEHKTLKVAPKALISTTLLAFIGCTFTPILLFTSYQYIATSTASVFHFSYPAIVVLLGIIFLKKKPQLLSLLSVVLCVSGIALFYDPKQSLNLTGTILVFASSVTYATYIVLLSSQKQKITGFLLTFYVALASSIMAFIACVATNNLSLPKSLLGWGLCILFAIASTAGGVALFQRATFLIGGEKASVLATLEPITSVMLGILILHDPAGINILIGSALVIAASLLIAISDMKKAK